MRNLRVWAVSLGCPKNRVDTEHLLGSLGVPIILTRSPRQCDIVFINTCAFIESAVRESLRAVFDAADRLKKLKRRPLLAVAGCLPGRYGIEELAKEIPEVDLWLNSREQASWPRQLARALRRDPPVERKRLVLPQGYAWLKIAEGCQRACAYCTIPAIRGPLQSIPPRELLEEAGELVASGIKELILVAQDSTAWGRDRLRQEAGEPSSLARLLPLLAQVEGLRWLRLLYLYPTAISDELLIVIRDLGAPVLPYLDLPLQHSELDILTAMNRPMRESPLDLVARIRAFLPGAALRTTLMTGFPGETEAHFRHMCDFVRQARFQHLGVFTFMAEEGTAAASMAGQIPDEVKEERRRELMAIQREISREWLAEQVGERLDVLVDNPSGEWPGLYKGHVWFQCPETDGVTYVSGDGVQPGALVNCEIADAQDYDLSALA